MTVHIKKKLPLFYSIIFFAAALIQGCENEPVDLTGKPTGVDPPEEEVDLLVNTWNLTDVQIEDATASLKINGVAFPPQPVTGVGSAYDLQLTFAENGSLTSMGSYSQTISLTLGLQSIDETREIKASEFLGSGTWTRTEIMLTIDNQIQVQEVKIIELTANSLILQLTTTQTDTISGVPVTLTGTITASFSAVVL